MFRPYEGKTYCFLYEIYVTDVADKSSPVKSEAYEGIADY